MEDALAHARTVVDGNAIAPFHEAFFGRDVACEKHQLAKELHVFVRGLDQARDVLARNDEHVGGRRGVKIAKGYCMLVLQDDRTRDLLGDDLTEDACAADHATDDTSSFGRMTRAFSMRA